jgi:hypothetical protein
MVQVPSYRRRSEPEEVPEFSGTDWSMFQDGREDAVPGTLVGVSHRTSGRTAAVIGSLRGPVSCKRRSSSVGHGIHNTIVS